MKRIIILLFVSIFLLGTIGCTTPKQPDGPPAGEREQFQAIDESLKEETTSFFDSDPSLEEVKEFCSKNQGGCLYYCKEINSNHEICSELEPPKKLNTSEFTQ